MANFQEWHGKVQKSLCFLVLAFAVLGARNETETKLAEAPKNLRAFSRPHVVGLQWDPVAKNMGYEVERSEFPLGPFKRLPNNLPQLTIYSDFIGGLGTNFYRVRSIQTNGAGHLLPSDWSPPVEGHSAGLDQENLLTEVQRAAFEYFYFYGHPESGLARASARRNPDICAIGASGMGLFNLGVGISRGFVTREQGATEALKELDFLSERGQRFHGAFPHFINGETGRVIPFSKYDDGADIVETAFLMEGVLFAREYFSQTNAEETEIRRLSDHLWRDVQWDWFVNESNPIPALIWHWSPDYGWKKNLYILGFNECQIVYVLALASPTHPVKPRSYWAGWESGNYGSERTQFGIQEELGSRPATGPPLFETQYSYLGLDPRAMFYHGKSYFDHFRNFCLVQIRYADSKRNKYKGYGPLWGITASAGPDGYKPFAPGLRDNGTLAPTASISSMPYVPAESLSCLMDMYQNYGSKLWGPFGFYDAFNFSRNWVSKTYLCIDEGPIAPMIENYRTGLCWKTFMKAPEIQPVVKLLNDGELHGHQESQ